jgi:uncharacterized protein (UPF0548 family)
MLPASYAVDRTRLKLGRGNRVFRGGTNALTDWKEFRLGWLETWPVETPIQVGQDVAIVARLMGFWWLNACRIVYTVDKPAEFGFAYGTLPGHAATGEERFLIEWDRNTGDVWYDILSFSRPHQFLTYLGYPYLRLVQRRFRRDSKMAMQRAVENSL